MRLNLSQSMLRMVMKMPDGSYDLDGKCVNCGEYHPCSCEVEVGDSE